LGSFLWRTVWSRVLGDRELEKIAALVDWEAFERLLGEIYAAPVGRPSYGPLVLLKCLVLQQWYRLSDPGLEEALSKRLSFRCFVGPARADPVPDHSTLSRFRPLDAFRVTGPVKYKTNLADILANSTPKRLARTDISCDY
jgi:Transposase domain (DUF772)